MTPKDTAALGQDVLTQAAQELDEMERARPAPFAVLDDRPPDMTEAQFTSVPLPASIRIGFQTFTVEEISAGEKERSAYQGYSSFGRAYLAVARKPNAADEANTLLHEVLHMCWSVMDIQDGDPEERTITKLTNSLCQIWRDNPDLLAYLNASLRPPGK